MTGPLDGVLVADFSQLLQGPFATQAMADLGARIIKVEPLGGDWTRSYAMLNAYPGGESVSFLAFNRNKESIALDLKSPEGLELARSIIRRADVVVENFRPGVMDRLGIGYEASRVDNPGLVYVASSGFGVDGPYATRPGQDLLAQSVAGLPMLQGNAEDPPVAVGVSAADVAASFHIIYGTLAALIERGRTGIGQRVDVSLLNSVIAFQTQEFVATISSAEKPQRPAAGAGNAFTGAPYGIYRARNGYIAIAMNPLKLLAGILQIPELMDEESKNVMEGRDLVKPLLDAKIALWDRDELLDELLGHDVWCAPVNEFADVPNDPQVVHNRMFRTVEHPTAGEVTLVAPPIRFSNQSVERFEAPPLLGAHTRRIAEEFGGLDAEQIDALIERKVFRG
ncbi:CaiB/BaiF CoA transferase family protein [Microbacterium fluvii]|uniref:CaiB/BaiF CoA transferase family protein n=1 Tax=Microbacterium fluvii TaxID=415215 RepID=A0ABW2HF25_9MICO|nr:CaiB/BaiF CoA-transferase family protein [Microbacterium fluvii]MCU4672784.1 CoA transferase [Microbacterium fluvii]